MISHTTIIAGSVVLGFGLCILLIDIGVLGVERREQTASTQPNRATEEHGRPSALVEFRLFSDPTVLCASRGPKTLSCVKTSGVGR